jgi:hypothetical protein
MGQTFNKFLADLETGLDLDRIHGLYLDFDHMQLQHFAACVKRYANNQNKGWISLTQLEKGFEDTYCD